jgi:hypothetical protein
MRTPELDISAEPTPCEVQYLEDRLYEFNSGATGITDGEWLAIFYARHGCEVVAVVDDPHGLPAAPPAGQLRQPDRRFPVAAPAGHREC